jgi:glycosyltransferase involved in cell wall biosynthesis
VRIALVTHKVLKGDGQGRVNYEIARAVLRRGHQVVLVASQIAPELDAHPSVSWVRIPVAHWPTELLRNQIFAWHSFRWLRTHSHQFDVVHVNGFITWAASDVNAAHFVHSSWLRSPVHTARLRRDPYGLYQYLYTVLNARWEKQAFRQARVVVAVSEKIRKEVAAIGVPDGQIHVIPNGVDLREFTPGAADREKLGLPVGVPLALFVGEIRTPRKNLDTVLRALADVPELHLAVAGSVAASPYPPMASQLGLSDRVRFLGYREDASELMRAADLFVFLSRYEAHPLVVLEAMASGLPVITATTAGAAELVDEECGILFDNPEDAEALAVALRSFVRSPANLKSMGRAARAVAEQYSWQRMSESYLRLYEDVVNQKESVQASGTAARHATR